MKNSNQQIIQIEEETHFSRNNNSDIDQEKETHNGKYIFNLK